MVDWTFLNNYLYIVSDIICYYKTYVWITGRTAEMQSSRKEGEAKTNWGPVYFSNNFIRQKVGWEKSQRIPDILETESVFLAVGHIPTEIREGGVSVVR